MSLVAVILISISAIGHALWNLLSKKRNPSIAFFLFSLFGAGIFLSPVLIYYRTKVVLLPPQFWNLLVATAFAQALYFIGLAGAYRRGDISLAYPIARAIPVVCVACYSLYIGEADQITTLALVGMALVAIGCVLVPMNSFRNIRLGNYLNLCFLFIVMAGLGTTLYTIIDDQALGLLRTDSDLGLSAMTAALLYISLQTVATIVPMSLATVCSALALRRFVIIAKKDVLYSMLAGVVIACTYLLVLTSMAFVTNVSYVAAYRQLSIPLAAVAGMTMLGESMYPPKAVGILLLVVGLVMVVL